MGRGNGVPKWGKNVERLEHKRRERKCSEKMEWEIREKVDWESEVRKWRNWKEKVWLESRIKVERVERK